MACDIELSALYPDDVYFVVGVANDKVNGGVAVAVGDTSFTIESFKGWKVRLLRNGSLQFLDSAPPNGDTWYQYTSLSGEYTVSQSCQDLEIFIAQAYKPA